MVKKNESCCPSVATHDPLPLGSELLSFLPRTSFHPGLEQHTCCACGRLANQRTLTYIQQHIPSGPSARPPALGPTQSIRKGSPVSDVAVDAARRDNTGVGGIATLSTVAGFFLVITADTEPSFLLCVAIWSTFKWGLGIPKK